MLLQSVQCKKNSNSVASVDIIYEMFLTTDRNFMTLNRTQSNSLKEKCGTQAMSNWRRTFVHINVLYAVSLEFCRTEKSKVIRRKSRMQKYRHVEADRGIGRRIKVHLELWWDDLIAAIDRLIFIFTAILNKSFRIFYSGLCDLKIVQCSAEVDLVLINPLRWLKSISIYGHFCF